MQKPVVGISSCLLGRRVRHDGRDRLQPDLVEWIGDEVELLAICPEVAIGMGIPRPPIQLTGDVQRPEARQVDAPEKTFTLPLKNFALLVSDEYVLDGYIFKSRSPSCGLGSTPLVVNGLVQSRTVSGIYASSLTCFLPYLPVIEAESLVTRKACQEFLQQCQTYKKMRLALERVF